MPSPNIHVPHTIWRSQIREQPHYLVERLGVRAQIVPEDARTNGQKLNLVVPYDLDVLMVAKMRLRIALLTLSMLPD